MPLKQLGEFVGVVKLEMPDEDKSVEDWDEYCRTDVLIIVKAMQTFWAFVVEHDLGNFAYTLPSQAFAAFRHRFMSTPIFIDDNEEAAELSRKGYFGARTEAFQLGRIKETVTCLDINSQYPFIMATTPVPTRLIGMVTRTTCEELSKWLTCYALVADVTLTTTEPIYPKKVPGWTIFPVGRFRTVLNTPELVIALETGAVRWIHAVAVYERAIIFKDYVDFFYEQRMEAKVRGDETLSTFLKLFMNSLYGKFGQNGIVFEHKYKVNNDDVKTWIEWDADRKTIHRYRQFAGIVEELQRETESRESFPAIAGHITSAARVLLAGYISQAQPENTIYVDTDSLFVNDRGARNLHGRISESELGWLKEEWKSDNVTIYGAKDYQRGSVLKRKGVKKNAETLDESTIRQDQFRGFKGMIQDGDLDHMEIRKVTKHLTRVYSKGEVDLQGRVHPLRFPHPDFPDQ